MDIPFYEPFTIRDLAGVRGEIERLGLDLRVEEDVSRLLEETRVGDRRLANRFCVQPMEGHDAEEDGAPGVLTHRRYIRYATGGFGLIWVEATAVCAAGRAHRAQLHLHGGTQAAFASWVDEIRCTARAEWGRDVMLILQMSHSGGEDRLEPVGDAFIEAATLAGEAGFDGVDLMCCGEGVLAKRLAARPANNEGSFADRSRLHCEILRGIRERCPDLLLAVRLSAYNATRSPYGFGVDGADYRRVDPAEPNQFARMLRDSGVSMLSVTAAGPNLRESEERRAMEPLSDHEAPHEHPLMALARQLELARALRTAVPGMSVVGGGFTWLRQFLPQGAAGAVRDGAIDIAGMGRSALAYPDAPADLMRDGGLEPGKCCMVCYACARLLQDEKPVGCMIRDAAVYGAERDEPGPVDPARRVHEARRCHQCEAAPCIAASPTGTEIPTCLSLFARGRTQEAYEVIRRSDPLPELTAQLAPGWLESEGACIESALSGSPVPIQDLQYAISWTARREGQTGLRMTGEPSGRRVAVVGGGPAGMACTVRLLERGHCVVVIEGADCLGGVPERVVPNRRFSGAKAEMDAILGPAQAAGRLGLRCSTRLGGEISLQELLESHDAVLLAAGLWQERSIGNGNGITNGLQFLQRAKGNGWKRFPRRVAVLSGGDSAMDVAVTAKALGADEVYVVYGGPRSDMHWHLTESWFATEGVHLRVNAPARGYEFDRDGALRGMVLNDAATGSHGSESLLHADLVVEADSPSGP